MTEIPTLPLADYVEPTAQELDRRAHEFRTRLATRRTVRDFSDRPVARSVIEDCIAAAGTAPSGANQQPWRFVAINDPAVKRRIRLAAEEEEREFYDRRAPQEWLDALAPIGTDWHKPFLETAPWLIAIFTERWHLDAEGNKVKHYYPTESIGIATGLLIAAVHSAGLVSLTHTPSPMGFLNEILGRPGDLERPFLLLVVGYPAAAARVPAISRKPLSEIAIFIESKGSPDPGLV
jgi:nitroreductase